MNARTWGIIGGIALLIALLSPVLLNNTRKVKRIFKTAERLYDQGQYEAARLKYEEALEEAGKIGAKKDAIDVDFKPQVNYKIARCLTQLSRVDDALQQYGVTATRFPDSRYATDSYVARGDIYFELKAYEAASEEYKQALDTKADVGDRGYIHQKYQLALDARRNQQESITTLPEPEPEEIDATNYRALTDATQFRFEKDFEAAARQYEAFANTYLPAEAAVYALYWAGRCYADAGLFRESERAFRRIIDDYPYMPNAIEAYHGLAETYAKWAERDRSKYENVSIIIAEAEQRYREETAEVRDLLSRMRLLIGELVPSPPLKSVPKPEPPQQLKPTPSLTPAKLVQQGEAALQRGDLDTARRKAEQALKLNRKHAPARGLLSKTRREYYLKGLDLLDANRYEEAIPELKEAISMDAQDKEAHLYLGEAYFNLHNYADAEKSVREALKIEPTCEEARRLLAAIKEQIK